MIDSTIIRANRHAAGARGGQENEGLGRGCGGFSSKIHARVDALGMPLAFIITGGEQHDVVQAGNLVEPHSCAYLLADRGYDSDAFRQNLIAKNAIPVIPGRKNRLHSIEYDRHIYKERNAVERFFGRLKEFRRIATRYDKTALMFRGALLFAAIFIWCNL